MRVNPLGREYHKDDMDVLGIADIHGIVLPKAESGADVTQLAHRTGAIPIHAIVTETPASLFGLLSYRQPGSPLAAMSWGAEDLSAALGASSKYDESGDFGFTYKLARSLCLAGAVAAGRAAGRRRVRRLQGRGWPASAKPRPRAAKASPASSRFTPPRCRSSTPPSRRPPRK